MRKVGEEVKDLHRLHERIFIVLSFLAYLLLLHWSYVHLISPSFSYLGYIYNPPAVFHMITVWGLALIPSLWVPIKRERPSQIVYLLLYALVFVPAMIIPLYTLRLPFEQLLYFDVVLLFSFLSLGFIYRFPLIVLPRIRISPFLFWWGLILLSIIFYAYIIRIFGFQLRWVSLLDVYKVRAEYDATLNVDGGLSSYFIDWLSIVVNPLLIVIGLIRRKLMVIMIGLLGQLMIYSITGNRTAILSAIYLVLLLMALRKGGKKFGINIALGLAGLVIITSITDMLTGTNGATSLFVRRIIITPGLLTGVYYQFFSVHPKALLAHSIFKGIISYPYSETPPHIIGYIFWGNINTSANANVWADAYANYGMWGIFGFTVLLGLLLWTFDCFSAGRDQLVTTMVLALPSLTLVDGALFTALGNHGLGFAMLLVYFLPVSTTQLSQHQGPVKRRGEHRIGYEQSGSP